MKTFRTLTLDLKSWKRRLPLFGVGFLFLFFLLFCLLSPWVKPTLFSVLRTTMPYVTVANEQADPLFSSVKEGVKKALDFFFQSSFSSPASVISAEIPMVSHVQKVSAQVQAPRPTKAATVETPQTPVILPENQAPIKAVDLSAAANQNGGVAMGNETSYSIDIEQMLSSSLPLSLSGKGPKVLIIHTHATESYAPEGSEVYDITGRDRSENTEENVVAVGKTLCDILNQNGIETLHDTALHDVPSFNGSYAHSLSSMESYLAKYPSIELILDLHRDAIVYSDNTKARPVTLIDGKPAAQLMLVVGTDEKGLHHPSWRQNLTVALHFQRAINARYPTLMRYVNLRQERFNGHAAPGAMIIEVGSSGNSLSEAKYAISLAAECIMDCLK